MVPWTPPDAGEAFRLLYYGFFFPNTKYAKLDAGLTVLQYAGRGLLYAADLAAVEGKSPPATSSEACP